ncbi:MAG: hypothetical protein HYV97_02470 [Bdellovibrio sp.]|nr:hypothetical protein [Bdellovibrio sp.]
MGFCARLLPLVFLLMALMFGAGCATSRTSGWDKGSEQVTLSDKDKKELEAKAQAHWGKRHVKEELLKFIDAYETLSKADQNNYKYLVGLCRGYYLFADGHLSDIEEKKLNWEKGVTFGERAMATNPDFKAKVVAEGGKVEAALDTLTKNEIESIYWTAVNLGKWGKAAGIATVLKYKTRIKEMITRVGVLDPTFFHGAVERYWGAYYAIAPSFAGGDLNKSESSFKKSLELQKDYLGTYVLYAELYASKKGDRKLFQDKLNYVLKADAHKIQEIAPENLIEQAKARRLLEQMEELF